MKVTLASVLTLSLISVATPSWAAEENHHEGMRSDDSMDMSNHEGHTSANSGHQHPMGPSDCSEMEVWDYSMGMCIPLPMKDMQMSMLMIHGNAFGVESWQERPRGRNSFAAPNMFMANIGTSIGDHHYINLDFMGTLEKWTEALTLGYTRKIATWDGADVRAGASLTKDILPSEFQRSYGESPVTGRVFLQIGGMKMWDL